MTQAPFDLAAIYAHPKFPFSDWQQDDLSFLMLEMFWAELFRDVLGESASEWTARFDTPRDGNPILAVGHAESRRAFRVVVTTNVEGRPVYPEAKGGALAYYHLFAFMNLADEGDGNPPWNELGFFAELAPSMIDPARFLIEQHCVLGKDPDEMEDLIASYEEAMEMGADDDWEEGDDVIDPVPSE